MYYDSRQTSGSCAFDGKERLLLITNRDERSTEYEQANTFFEAGGRFVQVRMKDGLNLPMANAVVELTKKAFPNRIVFIDDSVDITLKCRARGVHLGKTDMPIREARKRLSADQQSGTERYWIGATANTFEDLRQAAEAGADYIGLGPYRYTDTKKNLSPVLGLEGYRSIIAQCLAEQIYIPIFAIGGITVEDVGLLMQTGINGIAVSGAIVHAADPALETKRFLKELTNY